MTIELDFKQALRLDMERKGLSEAALGKALGITQQAVHKWLERGFPPLARLDDLLDVLGEGSEVSKLDHKSIYSGRSRTPRSVVFVSEELARQKQMMSFGVRSDISSETTANATHAWMDKFRSLTAQQFDSSKAWTDFKNALPVELRGNLDRRVTTEHGSLAFDYASDRVVAELVSVKSMVASHNLSAKILELITYAHIINPTIFKLLVVVTEAPPVKLSRIASTAAKAFGVHIEYVKNGEEAANLLTSIEGEAFPELIEPND